MTGIAIFATQRCIAHSAAVAAGAEPVQRIGWEFDPLVISGLCLSGFIYARGVHRLWSATRKGRGIREWEAWCFAAGWLSIVLALVSPLHQLGQWLFSAHMTQHEILMLMAAPLIVLGRPAMAFLWALPAGRARQLTSWSKNRWREKVWRFFSGAFAAWGIHGLILWGWHIPALFEATLRSNFVHALQHTSFLFSALLFWWAVLHGRRKVLGYGLAILYMFSTALHSGLLGALLTFARAAWYPTYANRTEAWGISALEDQQLGGLIMWVPGGVVYIIAAMALFVGWMRESDKRVKEASLEGLAITDAAI
jgi:putative membrane protein